MRAHIHFDRHGQPQSVNNYLAMDGFQQMGWEIVPYTDAEPVRDSAPGEIVVGHMAAVRAGLRALGLAVPAELGYPEALKPFWGRRLWASTINAVAAYLPVAPAAFSLDVGVTAADATLVVEVNDGYALGAYGLMPLAYAKFLSARWAQLTGTEDYGNF